MIKTKLFLDTEFTGLHKDTTLISIGIVSECGKTFYAELTDYNKLQIDDWLQENVIDKLILRKPKNTEEAVIDYSNHPKKVTFCGDSGNLKTTLEDWFSQFNEVEIWSDCLSYDWVLFNHIFGTAFDIPKNVYYIPFDICTIFKAQGIDPDISREAFSEYSGETQKHNALYDALVIKACHEKLNICKAINL